MGRHVDIVPPAVVGPPLAWRYRWLRRPVMLMRFPGLVEVVEQLDGSGLPLAERCARLEAALDDYGHREIAERRLQNQWECRQRWQQRRRTDRGGDAA